ncbi:hypothetical protein E1178_19635 [Roseibium hamelinense]|nr:hypothetical protein [Roseibium hamelinense]
MPRDPATSGVVAGIVAALGYEIGNWIVAFYRFLELPRGSRRTIRVMNVCSIAAAVAIIAYSLSKAADWQNATRAAIGLGPVETSYPFEILGIGAGVTLALWLIFRLLGLARRWLSARLDRFVPRRIGYALSTILVLYLFWALVDGALIRTAFRAADASFEAADILIEPDVPQPSDPEKTGSPQSLVKWEEMGRWGRAFVSTAPTCAEIEAFFPGPAQDALRVYVGRRSADTAQERADLALDELIRVGGFDRSSLVVMVPVGTGWMDPGAQDTLDFILGGDVATVAVQYSYLTSVLSLLAHPDYGIEQSRLLFKTIYNHWTKLPPETRPRLYVHGLSQGAFNSQATLPLLDMLSDPIDGAMWAGSPFFSRYWSAVRDNRNPGSPAWRPTYGNGSVVRVMNQYGGLNEGYADWGPIRAVFLNYGSDPIVNFTFDSAFRPPAWMAQPRAPDVSDKLSWFPIVTMLQLALDSSVSLNVPHFGHYYVAPDYIDAWAAILEPQDWSEQRADQLKEIFRKRGPAF